MNPYFRDPLCLVPWLFSVVLIGVAVLAYFELFGRASEDLFRFGILAGGLMQAAINIGAMLASRRA